MSHFFTYVKYSFIKSSLKVLLKLGPAHHSADQLRNKSLKSSKKKVLFKLFFCTNMCCLLKA